MVKTIYWIQHKKRREAEKKWRQRRKNILQINGQCLYGKAVEHLRNRIDVKLENNEKDYLKRTSKPNYMSHNTFFNNLIAIRKRKITLTLDKPAYIGICILDLSKLLMYRFRYDGIENKYGNNLKLLFTDSDSLMYEK